MKKYTKNNFFNMFFNINKVIIYKYFFIYILYYNCYIFKIENFGDWGLGIGDWGLGIGPNPQSPIPNPQSPIPNPHCTHLFNTF